MSEEKTAERSGRTIWDVFATFFENRKNQPPANWEKRILYIVITLILIYFGNFILLSLDEFRVSVKTITANSAATSIAAKNLEKSFHLTPALQTSYLSADTDRKTCEAWGLEALRRSNVVDISVANNGGLTGHFHFESGITPMTVLFVCTPQKVAFSVVSGYDDNEVEMLQKKIVQGFEKSAKEFKKVTKSNTT